MFQCEKNADLHVTDFQKCGVIIISKLGQLDTSKSFTDIPGHSTLEQDCPQILGHLLYHNFYYLLMKVI